MFSQISLTPPPIHHEGSRVFASARRAALIVQDDPPLLKAMSKQLGRMNFQVSVANHFDAAVRSLATREHHVVCIDARLPSKSGYDLCEHIRGPLGLAGLPILLFGEYGNADDMAYAEDVGGNAFLRKPFSMPQFARSVESLVNTSHSRAPLMHELQPLAAMRILAEQGSAHRCVARVGLVAS
ncbi:MAG: response regulator [Polyangiaceae bacterium]|jgi:DNA-binding response OmpR family regulator